MKLRNAIVPFFMTEEAEAGMIAVGYEFELPFIDCTVRLSDVLEGMSDAELALHSGEIVDQDRDRRQEKPFTAR